MSTATVVNTAPTEQEALTPAEQQAWRALMAAHACLAKRLDAALESAHRLPTSSYEVLQRLGEAPGGRMRMCDLAERAQLSRSGLTRLVDRLEGDGLLERCSCQHDARGSYACLTGAGLERLGEARRTHLEVVRQHFLAHFSGDELGLMAGLFERIAPCAGLEHPAARQ